MFLKRLSKPQIVRGKRSREVFQGGGGSLQFGTSLE